MFKLKVFTVFYLLVLLVSVTLQEEYVPSERLCENKVLRFLCDKNTSVNPLSLKRILNCILNGFENCVDALPRNPDGDITISNRHSTKRRNSKTTYNTRTILTKTKTIVQKEETLTETVFENNIRGYPETENQPVLSAKDNVGFISEKYMTHTKSKRKYFDVNRIRRNIKISNSGDINSTIPNLDLKYNFLQKPISKVDLEPNPDNKKKPDSNKNLESHHEKELESTIKSGPDSYVKIESDPNHKMEPGLEQEPSQGPHQEIKRNLDKKTGLEIVENLEPSQKAETDPNQESSSDYQFWNPFTITLITVATSVIVLVILVSAYHIGKIKAREKSSVLKDDVQPQIIIPRIRNVTQNPIHSNYI